MKDVTTWRDPSGPLATRVALHGPHLFIVHRRGAAARAEPRGHTRRAISRLAVACGLAAAAGGCGDRQGDRQVELRTEAREFPSLAGLGGVRLGMSARELERVRPNARASAYTAHHEVVRGHTVRYYLSDAHRAFDGVGRGRLVAVMTDLLPTDRESPVGAWHRAVGAVRTRRGVMGRCVTSTMYHRQNVTAVWDGAGYQLQVRLAWSGDPSPPVPGPPPTMAERAAQARVVAVIGRPDQMVGLTPDIMRAVPCPG
jgi:hypothetical protein